MFDSFESLEKTEKKKPSKRSDGMISINPKKDFHIVFNQYDIKIIKGEKIDIPKMFEENLKTEKVI